MKIVSHVPRSELCAVDREQNTSALYVNKQLFCNIANSLRGGKYRQNWKTGLIGWPTPRDVLWFLNVLIPAKIILDLHLQSCPDILYQQITHSAHLFSFISLYKCTF